MLAWTKPARSISVPLILLSVGNRNTNEPFIHSTSKLNIYFVQPSIREKIMMEKVLKLAHKGSLW